MAAVPLLRWPSVSRQSTPSVGFLFERKSELSVSEFFLLTQFLHILFPPLSSDSHLTSGFGSSPFVGLSF